MSNLFVDKISGKSGTSSGAPITLSGDTATLSSGVTIPAAGVTGTLPVGVTGGSGLDAISAAGITGVLPVGVTGGSGLDAVSAGKISNVFRFVDTANVNGGVSVGQTTNTYVGVTPKSFTAVSGRHYVIVGAQVTQPHATVASSIRERWSHCYLYWGTTSRTIGAVQTGDNLIDQRKIGSVLMSTSDLPYAQYWNYSFQAHFTAASSATHYVYTAGSSSHADVQLRMYANAADNFQMTIFEVLP